MAGFDLSMNGRFEVTAKDWKSQGKKVNSFALILRL